jgi:polygalacturonase
MDNLEIHGIIKAKKRKVNFMNVSILDFGASSDKTFLNTQAIQKAIDAVAEAGGGRVSVPAGTFVTGTIYLQDHVELHLEMGAVLKASANLDDYNPLDAYPENYGSEKEQWVGKHLVIIHHKTDVAITGLGTIDGSGSDFFEEPHRCKSFNYTWGYGIAKAKDKERFRPGQLIAFIECRQVMVTDITIQDSPCWTLFFHGCEYVRVRGLRVQNDTRHANTDGIDIDTCRYVTVSDCIIRTGDDAITIRAAGPRLLSGKDLCEHIAISNSILSDSAVAVRIGVGLGTVQNVKISGLVIERAAVIMECLTSYQKRGSVSMSDISLENVVADNVSFPFRFVQEGNAYIRDVKVRNIRAKAMCSTFLTAEDKRLLSDISIRDMTVDIIPSLYVLDDRAPNEKGWHTLWAKSASNLEFDSIRFRIPEALQPEWKGLFSLEDCENVTVSNCNFS